MSHSQWPARKELKEELVRQHLQIEENVVQYLENVLSEYREKPGAYAQYMDRLIARVENLLLPHNTWEEEKVFPLFTGHPLIEALVSQHREIFGLLSTAKQEKSPTRKVQTLLDFLEILKMHSKLENERLVPMIY
ncbi:hemerythrin domain-containing protein [Infirmifilum lucidum]|uniref:Hemerythrin domain-containing protein n=1 Tax=Infirmifilum lucidum TaxID=2776706 RepID=A0A7L9FIU1_9CREN|nr:hemerythrin domain-containing protein [Infirmifilum lucidum]QOJ78705.1 hemerythrin domain-containing protein [Infirmifilum lucidum]